MSFCDTEKKQFLAAKALTGIEAMNLGGIF